MFTLTKAKIVGLILAIGFACSYAYTMQHEPVPTSHPPRILLVGMDPNEPSIKEQRPKLLDPNSCDAYFLSLNFKDYPYTEEETLTNSPKLQAMRSELAQRKCYLANFNNPIHMQEIKAQHATPDKKFDMIVVDYGVSVFLSIAAIGNLVALLKENGALYIQGFYQFRLPSCRPDKETIQVTSIAELNAYLEEDFKQVTWEQDAPFFQVPELCTGENIPSWDDGRATTNPVIRQYKKAATWKISTNEIADLLFFEEIIQAFIRERVKRLFTERCQTQLNCSCTWYDRKSGYPIKLFKAIHPSFNKEVERRNAYEQEFASIYGAHNTAPWLCQISPLPSE